MSNNDKLVVADIIVLLPTTTIPAVPTPPDQAPPHCADASENAVVRDVKQCLGLFGGQSRVRSAHGTTLGNGYDRRAC